MSRLREFGERLAEIQDQVLREDDCLEEVRQRLFNDVAPHSSWSRRALLAATALAAGIAVAAAIILTSTPRPLTVTVGESTRDFEVGAWIAASPSNSLPIRFSDGSAVHLDPLSGARITQSIPTSTGLFAVISR